MPATLSLYQVKEVEREMDISEIKQAVYDAVDRGALDRQEAEAALNRIELSEANEARVHGDPNATAAQKEHALDELNAASSEAAGLINAIED
jgi:hypothetical protein